MGRSKRRILESAFTFMLLMVLGLSLGSAGFAQSNKNQALDIAILIDTSGSTRAPSGVDVNGNGKIGRFSRLKFVTKMLFSFNKVVKHDEVITDIGDIVLAAEVLATKKLVAKLDSRTTRLAIISFASDYLPGTGFSGDQTFLPNPDTPGAIVEQPLTKDFRLAREILDRIERDGPEGGTNMAEAIRLAIIELRALSGSNSTPRAEAKKVVILVTDGQPTFPEGSAIKSDPEDIKLTISAAELASSFGITIHTFGLGEEALKKPELLKKVAEVTGGRFTPVKKPGDIIKVLPEIDITNFEKKTE
jgi:hypothetical protein